MNIEKFAGLVLTVAATTASAQMQPLRQLSDTPIYQQQQQDQRDRQQQQQQQQIIQQQQQIMQQQQQLMQMQNNR